VDGLLIVDKPSGPTSHDVVQRVRRAIGQRRVGHTGTLDPSASGVLPLVVGRATRLARLLSSADKTYEAVVRLGFATDTYDCTGTPLGTSREAPLPARADVERALQAFRGRFMQQPPVYSAKKVGGARSYDVARASGRAGRAPVIALAPVSVTVRRLEILGVQSTDLTLEIECSAGFYVRSLAHDLGQRLGVGAHLAALRRTRSGDASLADAVQLDVLERDGQAAERTLVPLERMLPRLAAVTLTPDGVRHARHGRDLNTDDFSVMSSDTPDGASAGTYRLFDPEGHLLGIAEATTPGLLHPSVVLV
jgi:tRNA pseudouridine55 synthase